MKIVRARHVRGFSFIELLVALVISTAVLAGFMSAFQAGITSYSVQDRVGQLQENGRFALYFLQRDIRMAGYPMNELSISPLPVTGSADAINSQGTGYNNSDQVAISYQANMSGATDCLGNAPVAGFITNTYAVSRDPTTNLSRLTCNSQPIVEGVEAMQVLYGVDTDTDSEAAGYGFADYYVPANASVFTANPDIWRLHVVSVRIAMLVSSITPVTGDKAGDNPASYALLYGTPVGPLPSGVRGKVFSATIELRNRSS